MARKYRDKAGARVIQGRVAACVERFEGGYSVVVELSLFMVACLLTRYGLPEAA